MVNGVQIHHSDNAEEISNYEFNIDFCFNVLYLLPCIVNYFNYFNINV